MGTKVTAEGIFIDGKKTKLISGSAHYFRIVPEYWKDRLVKLKELGCNTVDTYAAWNVHEKEEGVFDFSGANDLGKFLDIAAEVGLYAVVRPGPYICSEWDFGGLPWWLLKEEMSLRSSDPRYMKYVTRYIKKACEIITPRQITRGGNVVFVQLENEYGNYGNDKVYLRSLKKCLEESGIEVPLFTSDSEAKILIDNGSLPEVWKTVNYRTCSEKRIGALKAYQKDLPAGVAELWNGRAMQWGQPYEPREVQPVADILAEALPLADYVNLYMYHGGSNFGFMNGAVFAQDGSFAPQLSSYDVDAPLSEYGGRTEKYYAEQKVIAEYLKKPVPPRGEEKPAKAYGKTEYCGFAGLFDNLTQIADSGHFAAVPSMEQAGQGYGSIVYTANVTGSPVKTKLIFPKIGDAAEVFINGEHIASLYRSEGFQTVETKGYEGAFELKILVSNLGRVNFGYHLYDRKGIVGEIAFVEPEYAGHKVVLSNWTVDTVKFDRLPENYGEISSQPGFYKYVFSADELCDTFVRVDGFTRGMVFINGFALGRHWKIGPQKTLYLPAPLLKKGKNELIIYDDGLPTAQRSVTFTDTHVLTELTK